MAIKNLVTYDNVASAAQALIDAGKQASVRAVINQLGGGSPNAVLPLLNRWKEANPSERQEELMLDPGIQALFSRQLKAACKQAVAAIQVQLDEVQADAALIAKAGAAAEEGAEQLRADLSSASAQIQNLMGRLEAQATELQKTTEALTSERLEADALRMEVVSAQTRAEVVPKLEEDLAQLQGALRKSESELAGAKTAEAVAAARFEAQRERADECARQRDLLMGKVGKG